MHGSCMQFVRNDPFKVLLDNLALNKGDTVFLHASFSRLKSFNKTPEEILRCILDQIGKKGSLFAPRYVWNLVEKKRPWHGYKRFFQSLPIYDLRKKKSNMGVICEKFRHLDGVQTSESYFWPVSGFGYIKNEILGDQLNVINSFGPESVFWRLLEINTKVLGLGVSLNTSSLSPVSDYISKNKKAFSTLKQCTFYGFDGKKKECNQITLKPSYVENTKPSKLLNISRQKFPFVISNQNIFFCYESKLYHKSYLESLSKR